MGLEVTNWIPSVFVLLLGDCFIVQMFVGCGTKPIMIHKEHDLKGSLISIPISPLHIPITMLFGCLLGTKKTFIN
jgi:hypothetical protein